MIRKFSDFITESDENPNEIATYRWFDFYKNTWVRTKCRIISKTNKTAKIKLIDFGPKGAGPGTILQRVHLSSLSGFDKKTQQKEPDLSWRKSTDPDWDKEDKDELNESKNSVERNSEAKNLVELAKKYFKDGDMENAGKTWCMIYDLYEDMHNEDAHTEKERFELFTDFQEIMGSFTDDEVFGITDYLKSKYFNKE